MSAPLNVKDYETSQFPTWCPGCGDFGIWTALKNALVELSISPDQMLIVFGVGCSGNMASFVKAYGFHGLHGRPLPVAEGAKMANHKLPVVVIAGDGDTYGEGMNHFLNAIRGNHDITLIVHDNQVYGLTTGQNSPTAMKGVKAKSTPMGVIEEPVNPIALALGAGASFIARGFAGNTKHLTNLMVQAMRHRGFSLIDVLQPCVTFNKLNTFQWFYRRVYELEKESYKPTDKNKAWEKSQEGPDKMPIGIFYKREDRLSYEDELPQIIEQPLVKQDATKRDIGPLMSGLM